MFQTLGVKHVEGLKKLKY